MRLKGLSVVVIGLGASGTSAAACLLHQQARVWGVDDHLPALQSTPKVGVLCSQGLQLIEVNAAPFPEDFDLVVVSPGVPKSHPWYSAAIAQDCPIIGEAELAISLLKKKRYRWVGVTGTNGKTTVTLLIAHLLTQNGIPAIAVGNVGKPLTEVWLDSDNLPENAVLVVELSSFQLETLRSSVFDVAVLLNITEDHLDRYASFQEYAKTKVHLFECLKPEGVGYIQEQCRQEFAHLIEDYSLKNYGYTPASFVYTDFVSVFLSGQNECPWPDTLDQLAMENGLVAYAVAREFGLEPDQIMRALISFKKPAHRLEFVCEHQGVIYIDDSKATNVDAVVRAVQSIPQRIILIAGGVDKGGTYAPWRSLFAQQVRCVCVIGQASDNIVTALQHTVPVYRFGTLEEAVTHAAKLATPNEVVLLSPGCSSYDMFSNYAHRGECFKAIVHELASAL